jgi:hypothetical protein
MKVGYQGIRDIKSYGGCMKVLVQPSEGFNNFCAVNEDSKARIVVVPIEQIGVLFLLLCLQFYRQFLLCDNIQHPFVFAQIFNFNRTKSPRQYV